MSDDRLDNAIGENDTFSHEDHQEPVRPSVSCVLTPEIDRLITERAQRLGISRAQFVCQVLEQFLDVPSPGRSWELDADHERETRG